MFAFGECGCAAEIPAFAGMEEGEERRKREAQKTSPDKFRQSSLLCESTPVSALISQSKTHSIPAKAGISFSRQREFSAKRNNTMFAFGECGCAAEIPAFAGMEGGAEKEGGLKKYPPTNLANGDLLYESTLVSTLVSNLSVAAPVALRHSNRRKIPHAPKNGSDIFWRIPTPRRFCAPPRAPPNCESHRYTSPGAFDSPSHTPPPAVLSCARLSHEKTNSRLFINEMQAA